MKAHEHSGSKRKIFSNPGSILETAGFKSGQNVLDIGAGSGYMAQNGYDLLVAAPWPGEYDVEVRFANGWVRTTARPGDVLTIRADGTVATGLQ